MSAMKLFLDLLENLNEEFRGMLAEVKRALSMEKVSGMRK